MSANILSETATTDDAHPLGRLRLPKVDDNIPVVKSSMARESLAQETLAPEDLRNPIFELLVQSESDLTGLLAYSLYKQNKRDWLIAFRATHGRDPEAAETEAFILGERLPRRTATYRRLAEDMLQRADGGKPGLLSGLMHQPANDIGGPGPALQQAAKSPVTWRYIGIMLLMLVAMAVLFRFAASWLFGAPGR
jgi:hypothetical protein